jgi:hypothetical protein
VGVGEGLDSDGIVLGVSTKAEGFGQGGFSLEDEDGSAVDSRGPFGCGGSSGSGYEDSGQGRGLGDEAYAGEDGRPGSLFFRKDGEIGVGGD